MYSDVDLALVSKGDSQVSRGAYHEFKSAVDTELQRHNRTVCWFTTNEHNLETSSEVFNTNTRIKKEGILLWTQTAT